MFPSAESAELHTDSKYSDKRAHLLSLAAFDVCSGHILQWREDPDWFVQSAVELQRVRGEGAVAFLDTTTLRNALQILSPAETLDQLPAGALLDLAEFANAYVFEDRLLYLDDAGNLAELSQRVLGREASSVLSVLQWKRPGTVNTVLTHLWNASESFMCTVGDDHRWRVPLRKWWSAVLGADLPNDFCSRLGHVGYRQYFSSIDSDALEMAIVKAERYRRWNPDGVLDAADDPSLNAFVIESTIRGVFCQHTANLLEANYYANAYRGWVRHFVDQAKSQSVNQDNQALLAFLQREFWKGAAADAKDILKGTPVPLPMVLPAAMRGVCSMSDLVVRLTELRTKAAAFRRCKSELAREFARGNLAAIRALQAAVTTEARGLAQLQEYGGSNRFLKAVFSIGGARPVMGALGWLVAHYLKLPDDVRNVLRARFVRPELWCLTEIAADSQAVIECLPALVKSLRGRVEWTSSADEALLTKDVMRLSRARYDAEVVV